MKYKKKHRPKKLKTRYRLQADTDIMIGESDDLCRTAISFWALFCHSSIKKMSFDIDKSKKHVFDYSLQFLEKDNIKSYKYQNNIITRKEFILLLGCNV